MHQAKHPQQGYKLIKPRNISAGHVSAHCPCDQKVCSKKEHREVGLRRFFMLESFGQLSLIWDL